MIGTGTSLMFADWEIQLINGEALGNDFEESGKLTRYVKEVQV